MMKLTTITLGLFGVVKSVEGNTSVCNLSDVRKECSSDGCTNLVWINDYGTCDEYCESQNTECVGAWEDYDNSCETRGTPSGWDCFSNYGNLGSSGTSDAICQCKPKGLEDNASVCNLSDVRLECSNDGCKNLVWINDYGTCEEYCASQNTECVGAWEDYDNSCETKGTPSGWDCSSNYGNLGSSGTSDAICQCKSKDSEDDSDTGETLVTQPPISTPTGSPTRSPTRSPTKSPTRSPTRFPTKSPTYAPVQQRTCDGYFCDKYIDTMFIVMTHNSLALPGQVLSPNQNYGLATQFEDGIRGFNLDLYMNGEKVKTCHGGEWCYDPSDEVTELMDELNKDGNRNEMIFIQLQSALSDNGNDIVSNWFGSKLVRNFDPDKPFRDYISQGKQVVLFTNRNPEKSIGIHNTNTFITENEYEWKNRYGTPPMKHRRGPTNPSQSDRYGRLMNYFCSLTGTGDMVASYVVHDVERALRNIRKYEAQDYTGGKTNILLVDYYETGDKRNGEFEIFVVQYVMRNGGSNGIGESNACPYHVDKMCAGSFKCGKKDYDNQDKYVCCKDTFVPFGWTTDLCVVEEAGKPCGTTEDKECAGSLECGKKDYWNQEEYVCCKKTVVPLGWTTDLCVVEEAGKPCGTTEDKECADGMACARTTYDGDYKCCSGTYDCWPWTPNCKTGFQYCL